LLSLENIFSFKLDPFQLQAIEKLQAGNNVLVCAPTGSGKTVIAEYAIHSALAAKKKVFYTTPLKALSNQKFADLSRQLGAEEVGLITGDVQVNRDRASVLVLTTEIFRNILYRPDQDKDLIEQIAFLVLDECHYMQDADRGTVWEESIIYTPKCAQIIALSATVGNPHQLRDWMSSVCGETSLIQSDHRPIALRFFFSGYAGFKPLTDAQGHINKQLLKASSQGKSKRRSQGQLPRMADTVRELNERQMLPAIYFLFSRKRCENATRQLSLENSLHLLNNSEVRQLRSHLDKACDDNPWLRKHPHLPALYKGIACHHAGLLPSLKALIEKLFQAGLIKIVFATETLAAGINMPARSTVISQISKRTDSGHRILSNSEFLQMAGRAGRRGLDETGYVLILETPYEGVFEAAKLLKGKAEDLSSNFTPNYTMALNLAARCSLEQARELLDLSFARYQVNKEIKALQDSLKTAKRSNKQQRLQKQLSELEEIPWKDFVNTINLLERFGFLEQFNLTSKGDWARSLRSDNLLLMAQLLEEQILEKLDRFELCAASCALTGSGFSPPRRQSWTITESIVSTVDAIYAKIKHISLIQSEHYIYSSTPFNPELITLGFDWATTDTWDDIVDKYIQGNDEGDLIRIFRQTTDILKRISLCAGSSPQLQDKSLEAYKIMHKFPVKEDLEIF